MPTDSIDRGPWFFTASGTKFYLFDPKPGDVLIEDIATSLANQCRFAGHVKAFYSVAQHSVLVSRVCDPADAPHGLLHDAAEAYMQDLIRPLKYSAGLRDYRTHLESLEAFVFDRFNLEPRMPASVARADEVLLATEMRDLLAAGARWPMSVDPLPTAITPLGPKQARLLFLDRYVELFGNRRLL